MSESNEKIKIQHKIEYAFFFTFAVLVRLISRPLAYWFARRIGWLSYRLLKSRRKIALGNLSNAYPEKTPAEIVGIAKECFEHMTISMVDMFRLDLYTEDVCQELMDIEGAEYLEEMRSVEGGVIFLTGHIGFWEAGAFIFPRYGFQINIVAKKIKNPLISHYIFEKRKVNGGDVIDKRNGLKKILKTFKNNNAIGVLLDQHAHSSESVEAEFFGQPTNTSSGILLLATKKQIPIVPAFCFRIEHDRFRLVIQKPIYLDKDQPLASSAAKVNAIYESAIREYPAQWMWIHKRWR